MSEIQYDEVQMMLGAVEQMLDCILDRLDSDNIDIINAEEVK